MFAIDKIEIERGSVGEGDRLVRGARIKSGLSPVPSKQIQSSLGLGVKCRTLKRPLSGAFC